MVCRTSGDSAVDLHWYLAEAFDELEAITNRLGSYLIASRHVSAMRFQYTSNFAEHQWVTLSVGVDVEHQAREQHVKGCICEGQVFDACSNDAAGRSSKLGLHANCVIALVA